jgi:3-oxoacyl-[acyl-carrier-protein] synthase II
VSRDPRVAVTGVGIVSALGSDQREFWSHLIDGRSGIGPLDLFDPAGCATDVAAQVRREPSLEHVRRRDLRRLSRTDRFCMLAAAEAVAQAAPAELSRFGVALGSTAAGMPSAERWCAEGLERGFDRARLSRLLRTPTSAPTDAVARMLGAAGPRLAHMSACASAALSIACAADLVREGQVPGMVAGGGDALCRMTFAGFNALRLLRPTRGPEVGSRTGLTLGEGAGVLVLERFDAARARGARPLAELVSWGASCDAHHMTAPHPAGRGAAAAMAEALARAGLASDEIGHINAHGTGTARNDASEAQAIRAVFGEAATSIPITFTKCAIGHLLGGSGGVEAVTLVLSLTHQVVPPTRRLRDAPEGPAFDESTERSTLHAFAYGLSNSFGFGGTNCCLLFASAS